MRRKACLYLVTDRCRLGESLGTPREEWRSALLQQIEGAVQGGVDFVQIRERDLEAGALVTLVREALAIAAGSTTEILVNDRIDIAMAANADGVHLREQGVRGAQVRRLAPTLVVGRSLHAVDRAAAADLDYVIAGSVFATVSKPSLESTLGVAGLAKIVEALSPLPVFAIGGVGAGTLQAVAEAGASGVAGIGLFLPTNRPPKLGPAVEKIVKTLRFAFDTVSGVS